MQVPMHGGQLPPKVNANAIAAGESVATQVTLVVK
jgi:hypothetical protein